MMEKRTLIAVLLTLAVLTIYNTYSSRQAVQNFQESPVVSSQPIAREDVAQVPEAREPVDIKAVSSILEKTQQQEEKTSVLESQLIRAEFSNMGGRIKTISLPRYNYNYPITNLFSIEGLEQQSFRLEAQTPSSLTYSTQSNGYLITKKYSLSEDAYALFCDITLKNISPSAQKQNYQISFFTIDADEFDEQLQKSRDKNLLEYVVSMPENMIRKSNAYKFSQKEKSNQKMPVNWAGFRDRYFCLIAKPEFVTESMSVNPISDTKLSVGVDTGPSQLAPGQSVTLKSMAYAGPQDRDILKSFDSGFEEIVVFSNFGLLNAISNGVIMLMAFMYKIIPSWGVCIILISCIIYFALYPLTIKGMMSMKRMQSLQPRINQLREQYKNNPQRLNKEIMEFYKENKINPLGGCFPLILQMPVFIALYQALWRSVAFKGASFLWIKDLSEPDRLIYPLPFTLPIIGNEFNILPILMMIVMFFQQKLSTKNMASSDPNQQAQQKIMSIFFPVFLGVIFYKFASGLALYFTCFYLLSTLTQWKMSKMT